jgi:hypothetical protein
MKKALLAWAILALTFLMASPSAAQDDYFAKQGFYQGQAFPAEAVIKFTYDEAWVDQRAKTPLRTLVKVLGKEKIGEDQYRVHFHYQRADNPAYLRDDVIIKKLDTNLWLMVDATASGGTAGAQGGVTRVLRQPPAR